MTLETDLGLSSFKLDHYARYLGQRSFSFESHYRDTDTEAHTHAKPIALPGPYYSVT